MVFHVCVVCGRRSVTTGELNTALLALLFHEASNMIQTFTESMYAPAPSPPHTLDWERVKPYRVANTECGDARKIEGENIQPNTFTKGRDTEA